VAVIGATAAQAAKLPPTSLSITVVPQGHQVTYKWPATVTGDLTNAGTHKPLSGQIVQLRERRPGAAKWTLAGTATTSSKGIVSFIIPSLTMTEQVQLVHPKTTTQATTSSIETIKVAYAVTAALSKDTVTVNVAPSAVGQTVQLQKQVSKTGWATVQTGKLGAGSATTFTIKPPKAKGTYHYRVVKPASSGFLQGTSTTPLTLVVG
jgi:hypothetical protein